MGKLGKKARKFAKKNLQSVLRKKRKTNALFKKKAAKKNQWVEAEQVGGDEEQLVNEKSEVINNEDTSIEAIFDEEDSDVEADDSDFDGYLSEDTNALDILESDTHAEDKEGDRTSSDRNQEIQLELKKKLKRLDKLKEKDSGFSRFLESNDKYLNVLSEDEDYSDDDESTEEGIQTVKESDRSIGRGQLLSCSTVDALYNMVIEQENLHALVRLLNGYWNACRCGTESSGIIKNGKGFSQILMLMLREADCVFRKILGISCSNEKKEVITELKNTSKWKTLQPLVKSYLSSTLFLLNEVTDVEILAFVLARLKASIILFAAFPFLLQRLIKVSVHLWATSKGTLSRYSYIILRDISTVYNFECYDTCLIQLYKAFITHCKFMEPGLINHIQFMRNSLIDLCSQDLHKSFNKALSSSQQLAKILQLGLRTKKKEEVKKICSWQFASCIDLWVTWISVNRLDYEIQPLVYMLIQIINGIAVLFPGPRYLLLRVKCVQWLNKLSSSSGIFIPIASLALDILEYKVDKVNWKPGKDFNFSNAVKLPKHYLKSQNFQEGCVLSTIELLVPHFDQWSYHISFPELATIPLICLRKFLEKITVESFRRVVKRFIDQVEQNVEFVRKKRDEVTFSPKDQQSVDLFLQLEKSGSNTPFTQYYRSIIEKASSRNMLLNGKLSSTEQKKGKKKQRKLPSRKENSVAKNEMNAE